MFQNLVDNPRATKIARLNLNLSEESETTLGCIKESFMRLLFALVRPIIYDDSKFVEPVILCRMIHTEQHVTYPSSSHHPRQRLFFVSRGPVCTDWWIPERSRSTALVGVSGSLKKT